MEMTPIELPSHETLVQCAREDEEAFEAFRREAIERLIESAPLRIRRRLRGLQFRIDCVRELSRSPLKSTIAISRLMWESFHCLNDELQDLVNLVERRADRPRSTPDQKRIADHSARILDFRPRSASDQT
jgi:hypothetical protein